MSAQIKKLTHNAHNPPRKSEATGSCSYNFLLPQPRFPRGRNIQDVKRFSYNAHPFGKRYTNSALQKEGGGEREGSITHNALLSGFASAVSASSPPRPLRRSYSNPNRPHFLSRVHLSEARWGGGRKQPRAPRPITRGASWERIQSAKTSC